MACVCQLSQVFVNENQGWFYLVNAGRKSKTFLHIHLRSSPPCLRTAHPDDVRHYSSRAARLKNMDIAVEMLLQSFVHAVIGRVITGKIGNLTLPVNCR